MQQLQQQEHQQEQPQSLMEPVDIFLTHVPANLRAKFRNARCRELLADPAEVQRVWSRLTPPTGFHGNQERPPQRLPPLTQHHQQPPDWYSVLSQQFNSNYSSGVSEPRQLGHNREVHSESVLQLGPEFNAGGGVGESRRLRKDEFSAYNEIVHANRKFNARWAKQPQLLEQALSSHREATVQRTPAPAPIKKQLPQQQQQQQQPVSILSGGGGGGGGGASKSSSSSSTVQRSKRVTISEEPTQQSLHRANTVQHEA